jgi:hypothetical protein
LNASNESFTIFYDHSPFKYTGTTLAINSPCHFSTNKSATTPKLALTNAKEPYWALVTQSDIEFASKSLEQIKTFKAAGNSHNTYRDLYKSLQGNSTNRKISYSDGFQWKDLVKSAFNNRQKSFILYAITAIAFCRWHED